MRAAERRACHDATHHVFAARLASGESRSDDDGEPAGTAGWPILSALESADLVNVVLVVTRYFRGTKLGTGELARAYGDDARAGLATVSARQVELARILHISYAHPDTGFVTRALAGARAIVRSTSYDDRVHIEVAVPVVGWGPCVRGSLTVRRVELRCARAAKPRWYRSALDGMGRESRFTGVLRPKTVAAAVTPWRVHE